ncbi:MAG: response regulator, partial [Chromatiales bacterium]|nr:response regulator [Chromatiales bacterium]
TDQGSIAIDADWRDERLTVSITDTGPGIPAAMRYKIFEPFQQNLENGHQKGAGLGLAISREIARAMGGDLHLTRSNQDGSQFTFEVTVKAVQPAAPHAATRSGSVLIAEDDPDIQALLMLYLQGDGYTITLCADGQSAVERALQQQPDLILMDINLPKLDGAEATQQLREAGYKGPIIAMTAAASESMAAKGGFDEYLQKPIDPKHLKESVATLLAEG